MKILFIITLLLCSCNKNIDGNSTAQTNSESKEKAVNLEKRIKVIVGIADACQEPVTFEDGSGLSSDILVELNKVQDKYFFNHNVFPGKRFIELLHSNKVHIASFHNKSWGLQDLVCENTKAYLNSADIYITLKMPGISQRVFKNDRKVSKVGVRGFHYKFVDYVTSAGELKNKYSMTVVHSEKTVIEMVLLNRCKIGVVSKEMLQYFKNKFPEDWEKLYISEKADSEYKRYYMITSGSPIDIKTFNGFLTVVEESGRLQEIYEKYGLTLPVK